MDFAIKSNLGRIEWLTFQNDNIPYNMFLGIRIWIPIAMDYTRGKMWKAIKMTLKNNQFQNINFTMNNGDELPQLAIDFWLHQF
jgi:hypothetical protein